MPHFHWDDHSAHVMSAVTESYTNVELIDCTLETSGGLVHGHKMILASCSPYLKVPKEKSEWQKIMDGFNNKWNFPNCIGATDGKHITIKCPNNSGSLYFNYKQNFSVVLLALVDNYNFTCIDVGSYESQSDGWVFSKSALKTAIEGNKLNLPDNSTIIGDDAFPLKEYLMKPYPKQFNQCMKERVYNYRHCRARRIVENAFGILASRFRIFLRTIDLQPTKVVQVVKASCALHNWIRKTAKTNYGITADVEDIDNSVFIGSSWRGDTGLKNFGGLAPTRVRNFNQTARQKRDNLADFFMGEGAVEWQLRTVNMQCTATEEESEEPINFPPL